MKDSHERAHKLMDVIDQYQLHHGGRFAITVLPDDGKLPKVKSRDFAIVCYDFVIIVPYGNVETPSLWQKICRFFRAFWEAGSYPPGGYEPPPSKNQKPKHVGRMGVTNVNIH